MLKSKEKKFFADTAWGISRLSACPVQRGATLIRDSQLTSTGYNRKIISSKQWEISAIYDAVFSAKHEDLSESTLFSTCFPAFNDMTLIIAVGVSTLYFFGEMGDLDTVELINELPKNKIPFEIIHLK